ncbi:hypothetical protein BN1723_013984 [Verticillium longisporum]|uniref:Histidinol-phosphatase n=1 Tax=Verticillium longisporum TaxID=100787 RepID=A0A0G4LZZ9_VERLO|nr:hypothetical protein BN1723_013984 [Verticillium longisporum]
MMKVTALYVYPIKGLRAIPLTTATFTRQGISHDRTFMLLKVLESGSLKRMQLSDFPACALFEQELVDDTIRVRYHVPEHEMLTALRPRVVGHFDLIRLLSEDPGRDVSAWAGVWQRIVRNLELVRSFDGLLECNSAALRKGLAEPYPNRLISEIHQ